MTPHDTATHTAISTPTRFIEANGRTLAYRTIGSGKPIVLCNRFRGVLDVWDPAFLDALAASGFQVVWFDYTGLGRSTGTPTYDPLKMSDDPHDHVLLRIRGAGTARSAGCESGSVSLRARAGGRCERCSPPMGMRCAVYPTHAGSMMSMRAAGVRAGRHRRAECRGAAGYCPFAAAALR